MNVIRDISQRHWERKVGKTNARRTTPSCLSFKSQRTLIYSQGSRWIKLPEGCPSARRDIDRTRQKDNWVATGDKGNLASAHTMNACHANPLRNNGANTPQQHHINTSVKNMQDAKHVQTLGSATQKQSHERSQTPTHPKATPLLRAGPCSERADALVATAERTTSVKCDKTIRTSNVHWHAAFRLGLSRSGAEGCGGCMRYAGQWGARCRAHELDAKALVQRRNHQPHSPEEALRARASVFSAFLASGPNPPNDSATIGTSLTPWSRHRLAPSRSENLKPSKATAAAISSSEESLTLANSNGEVTEKSMAMPWPPGHTGMKTSPGRRRGSFGSKSGCSRSAATPASRHFMYTESRKRL